MFGILIKIDFNNLTFWGLLFENFCSLEVVNFLSEYFHINIFVLNFYLLCIDLNIINFSVQHFKDLIRLRRTAEWSRSNLDTEVTTTKESPEIEPLPFTLAHERCISVVQKLVLFLLSMDFTCHADLLLFVCKVSKLRGMLYNYRFIG